MTVLVVDDDAGVREALEVALGAQDWRVLSAASGSAAVRLLQREQPDVVVSDVHMDRGDGFAVLACARRLPVPPAVILVSARIDPEDRSRALRMGAAAYLPKPFSLHRILALAHRRAPTEASE